MTARVLQSLRGFVRAYRSGAGRSSGRHKGHAIAKTIKHGTTINGVGTGSTTLGSIGEERRLNLMVEAAERYDSSFDER